MGNGDPFISSFLVYATATIDAAVELLDAELEDRGDTSLDELELLECE
jgi:hypothetical protein